MPIRYLLDTNICIYIAKHNPPAVRARFEQLSADALAMSVITLGELQHGAEKSQSRPKALVALRQLQSAIQVMSLTHAVGEHYGQIRSSLGACRTLGVESENAPQRDQFLPDSPPHSGAMGQEDGKKWAAAAHSQPTIPKSDRLLERAGQPIGNNDLWIAAHARAEGWVLVTNNEREFRRVEGLAVENWVIPAQDT